MTDVMIELYRLVTQKLMLTDQNIRKGYYFCFINALLGPCFDETLDTVIFGNFASLN